MISAAVLEETAIGLRTDGFSFLEIKRYLAHLLSRICSVFGAQQFFKHLNQLIVLTLDQVQKLLGTRATRHRQIAIQILCPIAEFLDALVGRRQGLLSHMGVVEQHL